MEVDERVNAVRVVFYIANAMNLLQQLIRVVHDVVETKFLSLQCVTVICGAVLYRECRAECPSVTAGFDPWEKGLHSTCLTTIAH